MGESRCLQASILFLGLYILTAIAFVSAILLGVWFIMRMESYATGFGYGLGLAWVENWERVSGGGHEEPGSEDTNVGRDGSGLDASEEV